MHPVSGLHGDVGHCPGVQEPEHSDHPRVLPGLQSEQPAPLGGNGVLPGVQYTHPHGTLLPAPQGDPDQNCPLPHSQRYTHFMMMVLSRHLEGLVGTWKDEQIEGV